jgi:hypothetical protein
MNPCEDYRRMNAGLCRRRWGPIRRRRAFGTAALMRRRTTALALCLTLVWLLVAGIGAVQAQPAAIDDPTIGFGRVFGLGGHACKQYDDTGKLYIYTEGVPSTEVMSWLQRSAGGTKPNIPMPEELETALPLIPGCLPGKHHAAASTG